MPITLKNYTPKKTVSVDVSNESAPVSDVVVDSENVGSMNPVDCLKNVVGITNKDCECIEVGRPEDYNESYSGLFVDNYSEGIPLNSPSATTCGAGSVWHELEQLKREGIDDFITDLLFNIGDNTNTFIDQFSGSFGEVNKNGNAPSRKLQNKWNGFIIDPNTYKGVCLYINRLGLGINQADTYTVGIYDLDQINSGNTTPLISIDIDHPGGGFQFFNLDKHIELPLHEGPRKKCYFLAYDRKDGKPIDYQFWCGCGDSYKPKWLKSQYINTGGFSVDDLSDVYSNISSCCNLKFTGGLIADFQLICDPLSWMCSVPCEFWYKSAWGRIASKVIQKMIAIKVSLWFTSCNNFTATSLTTMEQHQDKRNKYNGQIKDYIKYLASNMPDMVSHCWQCSGTSFTKQIIG